MSTDELGMRCPKCARVVPCEITHNGLGEVGLAYCCGYAFDGWPDTPIPNDPFMDLLNDLESRLIAAHSYALTDRKTSIRFLSQGLGTFRQLRKVYHQSLSPHASDAKRKSGLE